MMPSVCRFCKSTGAAKKFSSADIFYEQWEYYACGECKAVFLSPEPSPEQFRKAYDSSYYGEQETKFTGPVEHVIEFFRRRRAKYLASLIAENARVLDLGCGNGSFLNHLSRNGSFDLYGIEPAGGSARRASKVSNIKLKVGYLEKGDFPGGFFDAISLFHVFEHLWNPAEILDILKMILKKNGFLLISFPNIDSWQVRVFKGKWLHIDPPRHLFFFAPQVFVELMKNNGFSLVNTHRMSFEQNPFGWVQSILNKICRKRDVLFERLKGNKNYAPEYGSMNLFIQKSFVVLSLPFFVIFDMIEAWSDKTATVEFTFRKD